MTVDLVVPFAGGCPDRERAWEWLERQYRRVHPAWGIVAGTHHGGPWRKALAVADALTRSDADIVVVADADVWADELPQVVAAVEAGASWATLQGQVWRLSQPSTVRFMAGAHDRLHVGEAHQLMLGGGLVALRRDIYDDCPLDPRFVGWGGEDLAWGLALRTLHGEPARPAGRLWHLWHPPQPRRSRVRGSVENTLLAAHYFEARDNPDVMRALVDEGRAWASTTSLSTT